MSDITQADVDRAERRLAHLFTLLPNPVPEHMNNRQKKAIRLYEAQQKKVHGLHAARAEVARARGRQRFMQQFPDETLRAAEAAEDMKTRLPYLERVFVNLYTVMVALFAAFTGHTLVLRIIKPKP